MVIRVKYHNGIYDIVGSDCLQRLIDNGKIKEYYSYSEKTWIPVKTGSAVKNVNAMAHDPEFGNGASAMQNIEGPISAQDIRKLRQLFCSTSGLRVDTSKAAEPIIFIPNEAAIQRRRKWLADI